MSQRPWRTADSGSNIRLHTRMFESPVLSNRQHTNFARRLREKSPDVLDLAACVNCRLTHALYIPASISVHLSKSVNRFRGDCLVARLATFNLSRAMIPACSRVSTAIFQVFQPAAFSRGLYELLATLLIPAALVSSVGNRFLGTEDEQPGR